MPLRLIFMGTPDFAVPTLVEIAGRGHDVAAVYTRAAKPAGRGMEAKPAPVEREARRLGLSVTLRIEGDVRLAPKATRLLRGSEMTLRGQLATFAVQQESHRIVSAAASITLIITGVAKTATCPLPTRGAVC